MSGATAVAAQQQAADSDPTSWMVEVLKARTAYRANAAVMKTAEKMSQETIDTIT